MQSVHSDIELLMQKLQQSDIDYRLLIAAAYGIAVLLHLHHLYGHKQYGRHVLSGAIAFLPLQRAQGQEQGVGTRFLHLGTHSPVQTLQFLLLQKQFFPFGQFVFQLGYIGVNIRKAVLPHAHIQQVVSQGQVQQFAFP